MRNLVEEESVKRILMRKAGLSRILGRSLPVARLRKQIETIAACDVSVLVSGECGTGKELAARAIHYLSERAGLPFIPVNCGAIPENLFENELFGHRKGAFTDASLNQEGLVKESEGGTLFLDEIGVISPYIQVKLLRLLQDKEYKPLGDPKPRKANIRIVAATNRDLQTLVREGNFREDLFYRLNVVSLDIPPLRERRADIPLLVKHFIESYSLQYGKQVKMIGPETMAALCGYMWPGNVRQLENQVQHAVVMAQGLEITHDDLQLQGMDTRFQVFPRDETGIEYFKNAKRRAVEDFERSYLTNLMTAVDGNVVSAARKAGKSRTAFWNLLTKYNLHPRQFRSTGL